MNDIKASIAALGSGPLREEELRRRIDPLFSRVLGSMSEHIYLANHSLGRPLDRTEVDIAEGLSIWYTNIEDAWSLWRNEMYAFRAHVAELIEAPGPQCIVPKANAGQGLRAVLNRSDRQVRIVSTRNEFDSVDVILKAYAAHGRIQIEWVSPRFGRRYCAEDFEPALRAGADLVVVSMVFFDTGQLLTDLDSIVAMAHAQGAEVLVDVYHAVGVVPVDVQALGVDFAIGGSYKYLRGGPGAAWLFVHPDRLEARTLDIGWFAASDPFAFERYDRPNFAGGADGWLDSTPAVLPFFQARAGLEFVLAMGVERLRDYSLEQQALLIERLSQNGITTLAGEQRNGAFIVIQTPQAAIAAARLRESRMTVDARADLLRLCPDVLNSSSELEEAAGRVAQLLRAL
jgi:kynureninase